jgi:hypothetical protein
MSWFASHPSARGGGGGQNPAPQQTVIDIAPSALAQIDALLQEKDNRTPAQRKIDSQLIYGIRIGRGEPVAAGVQTLAVDLARDIESDASRIVVDVTANVSDALQIQLRAMGVRVIDAQPAYNSLRLSVTLAGIEAVAALPQVIFVQPKQEAMTSGRTSPLTRPTEVSAGPRGRSRSDRPPGRLDRAALASRLSTAVTEQEQSTNFTPGQGSKSSQGEFTHRAFAARGAFSTTGAGLKIGVISDGIRTLATSQALGDLPAVTVIGTPAPCAPTSVCDEGTAMLEIVHDLAPGAQLYFASGFVSVTDMAQKIRDLQAAGCSIIVDDVGYFVETPFQDGQAPAVISNTNGGVIAQAVKDVTALGVLYFSAAGNSGNVNDGTSGTWEGDFADGGAAAAPIPIAGRLHNFTAGQAFDVLTVVNSAAPITLHWSDPLGGSSNDYDFFRLNSTGTTVLGSSTNLQNGTQDPFEQIAATGAAAGQRIVVVKSNAAASRFLHVSTNRGRLSIGTAGEIHGHAATTATGSFAVAATDASVASPNPFSGTSAIETFSSDGPRRVFFNASGGAFTPGNFSSTGGQVLQKPDFTAADGVNVTGVGFFTTPFFGTSAAAPHAAAIAALIKARNPALTASQVRTALASSAIDIEAAGVDRDSGAGIIMAFQALQAAGATGTAFLADTTVTATESPGNGNGSINVGEGAQLNVTLTNLGLVNATGISATLTTSTPGVTVTLPGTSTYPDINVSGTGANATPFRFTVASNAGCPLTANFTLTLTYGGGGPTALSIPVVLGPQMTITTTLDATAPAQPAGYSAGTILQTGRMTRNGITSTCLVPKAFPGVQTLLGSRRSDFLSFNTCAENTGGCVGVSMSGTGAIGLFATAYSPSYFPGDFSVGYAADAGLSADTPIPFSFPVGPGGGQSGSVVVHEVDPGAAVGTTYTLTLSNLCAGACATPNQVPIARARNVAVTAGVGGTAAANIDNGSSDGDGDTLTITQLPPGPYPVGSTSVLLTVVDTKGATSQATGIVTVNPNPPTVTLTPSPLNFGAVNNGAGTLLSQTPAQTLRLTQSGPGTVTWIASANQPWVKLNGSGSPVSGSGSISVSIDNAAMTLPTQGALSATITVNTQGTAANNPTATVNLNVIQNGLNAGPIGSFDTPSDGAAGVTGSLAVTGWTVDDVAASAVRILRDPVAGEGGDQVFIGNAVFVNGARTDIASSFPSSPLNYQAGWGYLMLTNFLPNQGNGTFRLWVYADDVDGHTSLLGTKVITCTNATATKPFGAIDVPGQGETKSGAFINFGWALTPQPKSIATDGSTISVLLDSVNIGTVTYNNARPDIQALFPGYANTNGAIGFRLIDTTTLSSGVHTIAWLVTDSSGATDGIGSRYFTVANSGSSLFASPPDASVVVDAAGETLGGLDVARATARSDAPVLVRYGLGAGARPDLVGTDRAGVRHVDVGQLELLTIDLSPNGERGEHRGYERDGDTLRTLPAGASLDERTGTFSWQPGLAFGGTHELLFTRAAGGATEAIAVHVDIQPAPVRGGLRRMVIDTPSGGAEVGRQFTIAGWAIDGTAARGSGIDTLHVWAYPAGGGDPLWVGVAGIGGLRPDVAATFGSRFGTSGFTIEVADLPPGTYDIVVFAHSEKAREFNQAETVRVTVR